MSSKPLIAWKDPTTGKMKVHFPAVQPIPFSRGICAPCLRAGRLRRYVTHVVWQGYTNKCLGAFCPLCALEVFYLYDTVNNLPSARKQKDRA